MSEEVTIRDRYAMAALTGLLGGRYYSELFPHGYVKDSYKMADAMLAARADTTADARITAAAYEMLKAMEAAVECGMVPMSSVGDDGPSRYARQVHVADRIRAAIAKARGL